jgi:hypothetical protein
MTLTEEIYEKLMAAADDPAATEMVFQEYGGSKGPFYLALAKATASQQQYFKDISQKCTDANKAYQEKQQQIKVADQKLTGINQSIEEKTKEMTLLDKKIGEKRTLLDEIKKIAGLGFGATQLAQLHEALSKMAATQGVKPAEVAALFFNQLGNYQDLVFLELEVKGAQVAAEKAKTDVEFWQTQAKNAEAKSKARKIAMDFAETLITAGVKQTDIPHWNRIITKAGVKPEKLATALEQFGAMEKQFQHRQEEAQKLGIAIIKLNNQVKALTEERQQISDSIGIVRKEALAEMKKMSEKTRESIDGQAIQTVQSIKWHEQKTAEKIEAAQQKTEAAVDAISKKVLENLQLLMNKSAQYASHEHEVGVLASELVIARALKSQNSEFWKKVPFHSVREMLKGIIMWANAGGDHNSALPPPSYPLSSKIHAYRDKIPLNEVLEWAVANIFSDEEHKAATAGNMLLPYRF